MSKRHCYGRYCSDNGHRVLTSSKGKTNLEPKPGETPNEVVAWSVYWRYWGNKYPYLKVNKPSQDICGYCYRFHNRHKYKTNLASPANSGAKEGVGDRNDTSQSNPVDEGPENAADTTEIDHAEQRQIENHQDAINATENPTNTSPEINTEEGSEDIVGETGNSFSDLITTEAEKAPNED